MTGSQSRPRPPSKHQLALMIWLAVFPTLTVLNVVFGEWSEDLGHDLPTSPSPRA